MSLYLGLDCGGTKTAALIMDAAGAERGRGRGGPGNVAQSDDATLAQSLRTAVREACAEAGLSADATRFAGVCAGVAGYSVEDRRAAFEFLLRANVPVEAENPTARYRVEPDYVIAYWGATHGEPGIVVIAGTGAVAYGRNAEGQTHREDGLGYLLGDRGSGFHLGLRVLGYTLEQIEQGRTDALTQAVQEFTGARSRNEILRWLYRDFSPARVAGLAPVVGALAEAGDAAARAHVAEMARQLRHYVWAVRHKLRLPLDTPIYPLGGLWQIGAFLREEFALPRWRSPESPVEPAETWLDARFPIAVPKSDAAYGAALLAKGGKE